MANYATLKAAIDAVIKANGQREITGTVLNQTLNAMVNSLGANYQLAGVATPSTNPGTPDQNVFYLAFEAGTYTNFNATVLSAGISILMWNGSWSSQTFYTIDATPTASSNNLVSSGAVFDAIKTDGSAYDVSAHFPTGGPNNDGKFTLEYILSNANTLIPTAWRKGGMSIRFVQSSDNKYVQYRYMLQYANTAAGNAAFVNTANWQGVASTITQGSEHVAKSGAVEKYVGYVPSDSSAMNELYKEVADITGQTAYSGELETTTTSVNPTRQKITAGHKYRIYVQCDTAASASDNSGVYTSTHITNGANLEKIKALSTRGFNLGTTFYFTPETDLYLYLRTQAVGDTIDYTLQDLTISSALSNKVDKVSGKGLSTNDFTNAYKQKIDENATAITGINRNIEESISGIILPQTQLSASTTIVSADQVSEGDVLEIKYKGVDSNSRSILKNYNGSTSTWITVNSTEEKTAYYVVKSGFGSISSVNGVIISCRLVDNILNLYRDIESKEVGFVTSQIGNLFFKELFIEGLATTSYLLDYRFVIRRNVSGKNYIVLQQMSSDTFATNVSRLEANTADVEKETIVTVPAVNSSGIIVHCIVDWNAIDTTVNWAAGINVIPTLKALNLINSPRLYAESHKLYNNIVDLDLKSFTRSVGNDKISEFVSLDGVKYIDYRLHKANQDTILYFFKNPQSSYAADYWNHADFTASFYDNTYALLSEGNVAQAKIAVPKGYKYFAVRVVKNEVGDYVRLITKRQFDVEDNIRFLNTAKCISDNFSYIICGEPTIFYDKVKGLVYCKYLADNGADYDVTVWSRDPARYACLSVFPIGQPEKAQFHQLFDTRVGFTIDGTTYKMVYFGMALHYDGNGDVDGFTLSGADSISGKVYTFFMNMQYQFVSATEALPIKFSDNSDFNYENYVLKTTGALPADGDTGTVSLSGNEAYVRNGVTEYYGIISATPSADSTFTGYRHPQLVQIVTHETYREITILHDFNVDFRYEMQFLIDGDNWYYTPRSVSHIHFFISTDAGATWTTGYIRNSNNSLMRALKYDGNIIIGIPTICEMAVGRSTVKDDDSVYVTGRYSWELLRGNASEQIDMNEWEKAFTFASNYGINYFSLMLVGKDIYIAYTHDTAHIWDAESTRGVGGKCQIMFARIGNLDNNSLFGDI